MRHLNYLFISMLCSLVLTGCAGVIDDVFSQDVSSGIRPQLSYNLDISIIDKNGNDLIADDDVWPVDVYAIYQGKRYNCLYSSTIPDDYDYFGLCIMDNTEGSGRKILRFGGFDMTKEYDGEVVELHWRDGSVDKIKFTLWGVYDNYSGTYSWAQRVYLNGYITDNNIVIVKDNAGSLHNESNIDVTLKEPPLWTLNDKLLTDYNIHLGQEKTIIRLKSLNYSHLSSAHVNIKGCEWIKSQVSDDGITIEISELKGVSGESRACSIDIGIFYALDSFTITQTYN